MIVRRSLGGDARQHLREMMVRCVEQRFGTLRAPHPLQWLSDPGSIFAAHNTIEIALALSLVPCFTPVESGKQRHGRSIRADLQPRLCPGHPDPGCGYGPHRLLD
jgi:hypothetical protein